MLKLHFIHVLKQTAHFPCFSLPLNFSGVWNSILNVLLEITLGYISTLRNNVRSRAWGAAIGCSYRVERCSILKVKKNTCNEVLYNLLFKIKILRWFSFFLFLYLSTPERRWNYWAWTLSNAYFNNRANTCTSGCGENNDHKSCSFGTPFPLIIVNNYFSILCWPRSSSFPVFLLVVLISLLC